MDPADVKSPRRVPGVRGSLSVPASPQRISRRLATNAAANLVLWVSAVGAAYWYLQRALGEDVRALPPTDADSFGLPLVAFALLLAGVLLAANLLAGAALFWRRRRSRSRL